VRASSILIVVAAAAAGFAAGYLSRGVSVSEPAPKSRPKRHARISEVEPAIRHSRRPVETDAVVTNTVTVTNDFKFGRGGRGGPGMNPREWMENLKKNDPVRFNEMTNRMARWRQRRLERAQSKVDFLSSIDTSGWSSRARDNHERLQDLIAKREQIEQSLHDPELSDDERKRLFDELRSTGDELRGLNMMERDTLLHETVKALGVSEREAKEFTLATREIIQATDDGGGMRLPPPPPK